MARSPLPFLPSDTPSAPDYFHRRVSLLPATPRGKRQKAFLRSFATSADVAESARIAGIDRTTHYDWLRKDKKYRAAYDAVFLGRIDDLKDMLYSLGVTGYFKPLFYKGKPCFAERTRTLCQLADGTTAFEDELPKGARVTAREKVTTHDGEPLGVQKRDPRALRMLAALWMPEKYGKASGRFRKTGFVNAGRILNRVAATERMISGTGPSNRSLLPI